MKKDASKDALFTAAAIIAVAAFTVYFAFFLNNAFATFHEYSDLGLIVNNFYFNLHYPQIASGLQGLVFAEHLAPLFVVFSYTYAIIPSSVTVLMIQLLVISATALALFFISKDLLHDSAFALILCVAFLIYPGTLGQVLFDVHIEFPITLFFILTFYFWAKAKIVGFASSLLFLLGTADVAPLLAIALGLGLLFYEYAHPAKSKPDKTKLCLAASVVIISILALLLYQAATGILASSYAVSYAQLPEVFRVTIGAQNRIVGADLSRLAADPVTTLISTIKTYLTLFPAYLLYALLLVFFGFGISTLVDIRLLLIMALPWLGAVFILDETAFILPLTAYFGYVMGPILCASIMGLMIAINRASAKKDILRLPGLRVKSLKTLKLTAVIVPVLLSVCLPAMYLFVLTPFTSVHSVGSVSDLAQLLFFQTNSTQKADYEQIYSMISILPKNASVITNSHDNAASH